jgi:hypothetical protein
MSRNFVIVIYVLLLQTWCAHGSCNDIDWASLVQHGVYLEGAVFRKIALVAIQQCATECELRSSCQSFNYNQNGMLCELNAVTSDTSLLLVPGPAYVYSTKAAWTQVCH